MLNNEKLGFTVLLLSSLQLLLTLPSGAGRSAEPNANDAEEGAKRLLQGTTKDQPSPKIAESRLGTKKLLVVRVSSAVGESPDDSLDSIEGAIFGTGPNPDKVPREATVTAQYRAVTHNQLIYEPVAAGPNMTRAGLLEIQIELSMMDHSDTYERFDSIVQPAMMAKAVEAVGPLPDVADRVMFCLPTGSLKAGIAAIGDVGGMVCTRVST